MKSTHMIGCAVLLIAAIALLASGAGALAFLPLILCMLMMGAMMFLMMGGGRRGSD